MLCAMKRACTGGISVNEASACARTSSQASPCKGLGGRAADLRRHQAALDLHLQRAAVQDLLVEQLLAAHAHRAAGHLHAHMAGDQGLG